MIEYVVKLTKDATRISPGDHARLREVGFDDKAILTRQDLYRRLCEIIWDPARLGFTLPETRRVPGPTHRARTHYGVGIPQLMAAGLLKAGDTLVAVHRGTEHQAIILDDGRIKLAGGEPFTSLSSAAAWLWNRSSGLATPWTNFSLNAIPGLGVARKSVNGSMTSRLAANSSDEARRNLVSRA